MEVEQVVSTDYDPASTQAFFAVLLNLAKQSFSHAFAAISRSAPFPQVFMLCRYHPILKEIADASDDHQRVFLKTITELWKKHRQVCFFTCASKLSDDGHIDR